MSAWRILRLNSPEWPFLLLGVLGAALMGGSIPAYAVVFGKVLGVRDDRAMARGRG